MVLLVLFALISDDFDDDGDHDLTESDRDIENGREHTKVH